MLFKSKFGLISGPTHPGPEFPFLNLLFRVYIPLSSSLPDLEILRDLQKLLEKPRQGV